VKDTGFLERGDGGSDPVGFIAFLNQVVMNLPATGEGIGLFGEGFPFAVGLVDQGSGVFRFIDRSEGF